MSSEQPPQRGQEKGRRSFTARLLLYAALLIIGLPLLLILVLYLGLQTAPGRALLVDVIEGSVSEPGGLQLKIDRLDGPLPQRIELEGLELSDPQGPLVTVDRALLAWHPLDLLNRRLDIRVVEADHVALHRLPEDSTEEPPQPGTSEPFQLSLPELPISINLETLRVEEVSLSEEVAGMPARLSVDGRARLERDGALETRLAVRRIDDRPGNLDVDLALAAGGEQLTARVTGSEPAGGLVAELLDLPNRPPVELSLDGNGPPEDWEARLVVDAGEAAHLAADLHLDSLQPLDLNVRGEAQLQALAPAEVQPLLSDGLRFNAHIAQQEDGATRLDDLRLSLAAAELQGNGSLEADGETVEAGLNLTIDSGSAFTGLTSPAAFEAAEVALNLSGRLSAPTVRLQAELHDVEAPQVHLDVMRLQVDATTPQPLNEADAAVAVDLELSGEHLRLDDEKVGQALPGDPRLTAAGIYQLKHQHLTLEHLEASLAELLVQLSGEMQLPQGEAVLPVGDFVLKAQHENLSSLSALAGQDLRGNITFDVDVRLHEDGAVEGNVTALADRLHLGIPAADAMLGERPGLVANLRRTQDDQLHLEELHLDTATTSLTAEALIAADYSTIDAAYQLQISALEPLGEVLEQPLGGSLRLEGTAVGPVAGPHVQATLAGDNLSLPGDPARTLSGELDIDLAETGPLGSFSLEGTNGRYGPLSSQAVFALAKEVLFLEPFSFNLGEAANINGRLEWPLDGRPGNGHVEGEIPRLDAIAALIGSEAGGSLRFQADLAPEDEQQGLQATASLQQFRFGPAGAPIVQSRQVELQARARDLMGAPALEAEMTASSIVADALTLDQTSLTASGDLTALGFELNAQGSAQDEPLRLQTSASLGLGEESTAISLTSLELDWAQEEVRLLQPAEIVVAPDLSVSGLRLAILGGQLRADLEQQGASLTGNLDLAGLPLARVAELAGNEDVEGLLSAEMSLSGTMAAPRARLNLFAENLAVAPESDLSTRPAMTFRGEALLQENSLSVDASLQGFAETPLTVTARLPVRASLEPFQMELVRTQPLDANVHWEGDLAPVVALLPTDAIRLTGDGLIDLSARGSLEDPQLAGQVVIRQARYENYTSGTVLEPMELVLTGAERRLTLERLEASDGRDGSINGSGSLTWLGEEGLLSDLHIRFDEMLIAQRDDVTARISGGIDVIGNLFTDALISGRLTNDFIEVRLVDALPPSVAEIQVVEVRDGVPATPEEELSDEAPRPSPIALNVEIDLPRRVFVRGRGLESEWRGQFLVAGTISSPQISGEINPARGSFTVVGKTFVLQDSSIRLPVGAPSLDPELDLTAVYSTPDFRALVLVTGAASNPQIELSSEPELPQDEILSRVLFNKNSANLTAMEAIELADAAAGLATGGSGLTGLMRRSLGVDEFGFRPGATEDDPGSVAVGTYLGEGVYVGVQQGIRPGSTGVTVEIDITDTIKAHSDMGVDGRNRSGVRWQLDY